MKGVLFIQIILLNRRQPVDVSQMNRETFKSVKLENNNNNEFETVLQKLKDFCQHLYLLIIQGKHGMEVQVLLLPEMKTF